MSRDLFSVSDRPRLRGLASAALFSCALAALMALALSAEPLEALYAFFAAPLSSRSAVLAMFERAAPLSLCALGTLVAFKAGHFSLGGEGQVYAGALSAALAATSWPSFTGPWATALALAAGVLGGMLVAAPPALGNRLSGADVLLSSMLVSQGTVFVIDWLIAGPLRDTSANLIALPAIPGPTLLPRLLPPSILTVMPLVALAACALGALYLDRTKRGTMLRLYGAGRDFALLRGYPAGQFAWTPIIASGALHGLAGAALALGTNATAVRGMSGGMGWSAIGVALIAAGRPSVVPLAALLFAWLDAGGRQAAILSDLPPDSSQVIKAIVLVAVSARPAAAYVRSRAAMVRGKRATGEGSST